jgi:catechol 2,3-dioxygenase-like lactoylglutathione lyase family enzyme
MKRLHVSVAVEDLDRSVRFYSTLFAAEPTVLKTDYAKWMLDDPRVNFSITARGRHPGFDHLGIQVEDREELDEVYARLRAAERPVVEQGAVTCCYANSEKAWVSDPQGIAWEAFLTHGLNAEFGDGSDPLAPAAAKSSACCDQPVPSKGEPLAKAATCCISAQA